MLEFFSSIGITIVITQGFIITWFSDKIPFKWLNYLVRCSMCTGFWVGLFMFSFNLKMAFCISLASYITGLLLDLIQSLISFIINKNKIMNNNEE